MNNSFVLTDLAQEDLDEIIDFIAMDNPTSARAVLNKFYDAFAILADNSQIGHIKDKVQPRKFKFWSVYSYQIIYNPESKPLEILRILSGYRDIESLLNE
jgi:plasmid stabilization system protein ParE